MKSNTIKNAIYVEHGHLRLVRDMLAPVMCHPGYQSTGTVVMVEEGDRELACEIFDGLTEVIVDPHTRVGERLISTYPQPWHTKAYGRANLYKLSYGIGNDTWCRYFKSPAAHYLGWSNQDCRSVAPNTCRDRRVMGATKLLNNTGAEKVETCLYQGLPNIVIFGTYPKDRSRHLDAVVDSVDYLRMSNYSDLSSVARELTSLGDYNVIYKPHHLNPVPDSERGNYGIIVDDPDISNGALLRMADIVIADYGGSAVEAVAADTVLYVDAPVGEDTAPMNDTDVVLHSMLPHARTVHEVAETVETILEDRTLYSVQGYLGARKADWLRYQLFGPLNDTVSRWIKFLSE